MHIEKLMLSNFRGAKELSLELNSRLNVFVGVNGAGKTSILDATAILLSWLTNRIRNYNSPGRKIREQDIKNGTSPAMLSLVINYNSISYEWNLGKNRMGNYIAKNQSSLIELRELTKKIQELLATENENNYLPLLAHYPVNRVVNDIPLRIRRTHDFSLISAYDESLTSGANFRIFFEWFREREDLENENRKYVNELFKPEGFQFPDSQLVAVRKALEKFMPEFANLTVRRNPLRMEVMKQGKKLIVDQLSDGEKCLMAMIGDIARRLAIANPSMENPLEGEGIILIDEIDLHLHPKWQRMLIPKFSEVFPNCQFLISTHSPHVITQVKPEKLFFLTLEDDGLKAEHPSESYGLTSERILEDLMGLDTTRPDNIDYDFQQIFEQINLGELEMAKENISKLKQLIGEDPELVKASVLIKRKELIGK